MDGQVKRGFTLIELVVTLFVIVLAAGVAAPSIARGVDTVRIRAEAGGIAAFLRAAREQAVTHNRTYEVRVKPDEGLVELQTGDAVSATKRLAAGVRLADPPTARAITFPRGVTSSSPARRDGAAGLSDHTDY
jgi:prepilin-type N-terminal cleavage/methylation domain-containing protein